MAVDGVRPEGGSAAAKDAHRGVDHVVLDLTKGALRDHDPADTAIHDGVLRHQRIARLHQVDAEATYVVNGVAFDEALPSLAEVDAKGAVVDLRRRHVGFTAVDVNGIDAVVEEFAAGDGHLAALLDVHTVTAALGAMDAAVLKRGIASGAHTHTVGAEGEVAVAKRRSALPNIHQLLNSDSCDRAVRGADSAARDDNIEDLDAGLGDDVYCSVEQDHFVVL